MGAVRGRTVLAWAPAFWRRVLFPGVARADDARAVRFAWPILMFVAATVALPQLDFALFEPDEGRYAQIPREMLASGDWLVPTLQGEPYLDKPPLFYWLVALAYSLFGVSAATARLVPALAVIATVAVVYGLGRRPFGARAAFWGALLLALSPGLASMGRILVLDGLLTLWTTLGLLLAWHALADERVSHAKGAALGVVLGVGVLTKGLVILLLVLGPVMLHRALTGDKRRIGAGRWLALLGIAALVAAPWHVALALRQPEFASHFLWKHHVQRFLTPFDHEKPIWYFGPVVLVGLAPLVWALPGYVRFLLSAQPSEARGRTREMGYALLAGGFCVGFFTLSGCKLPTYVLPAFPPLCLALGTYVTLRGWDRRPAFVGATALWGATLTAAHVTLLPRVAWERSPMNHDAVTRAALESNLPTFCFPRPIDSVAFHLRRSDFQVYRSKHLPEMFEAMDWHQRSVVLFAHRSSSLILAHNLPPHFRVVHRGKLGLCDMALIERTVPPRAQASR